MVMQNSPLPFELVLLEGKGQRKIPITALSDKKRDDRAYVYEVEELVILSLQLKSSVTKLHVTWGMLGKGKEDAWRQFEIAEGEEEVLFEAARNERYPWRCGSYSFEVDDGTKRWYGTFRVRPKTLNLQQYEQMNRFIESSIEGLVTDLNFRKMGRRAAKSTKSEHTNWSFLQWFEQNQHVLFQTIHQIERVSEHRLTRYYVLEQQPKKQDARSARYAQLPKAQLAPQPRYYNRKFKIDPNDEANRYVKYQLRQLFIQLQAVHDMLVVQVHHREERSERMELKVNQLKERKRILTRNERVSAKEIIRSDKTYETNRIEHAQWEEESERFTRYLTDVTRSLHRLQQLIHSPFWRTVDATIPRTIRLHRDAAYQQFHELLMRRPSETKRRRRGYQSVVKPTALLYEYYMYFHTIQLLEHLGFTLEKSLEEQLSIYVTVEGLQEGAHVILIKGDRRLSVTYDEMIADDEKEALKERSHFFSGGTHRKPDIRIDEERLHEGKWMYRSSFIIEVKYRPLHNLYIETGKTDPMRQMCEYWMIKHVRRAEGKTKFTHHAVRDVICVYPGETEEPYTLETGDGTFLKYHPHPEQEGASAVGSDELIERLEQWLND